MPSNGTFEMYAGGTTLEDTKNAINAKATISLQEFCSKKALALCKGTGQETQAFNYPMGVAGTDEFLMALSELTGKKIPAELEDDRGRLVDAMTDSASYIHGKSFSVFGDPDFCLGMTQFLLELGGEPIHILATNGTKPWAKKVQKLLDSSPFGARGQVWPGKDMWHLRSLLFTEPSDYLIGSSYGKYLERDCGVPLIRLTFPIFDRHHHHRFPVFGYQGAIRVMVTILDKIFDELDRDTNIPGDTDISFELTR
jgi:nitrogenase molybdenum-iron protein beta chain